MDNLPILIGLIAIFLSLIIGWALGNRAGIKEGRDEMITRLTKVSAKQLHRFQYGDGIHSRN